MTLNRVSLFCKGKRLFMDGESDISSRFFSSGMLYYVTWFGPFHSITNQLHRDSLSYPRVTESSATPPRKPQHSQPQSASLMVVRCMSSSFRITVARL